MHHSGDSRQSRRQNAGNHGVSESFRLDPSIHLYLTLTSARPSAEAQASMIQDCYRRAGLDISKATDRPQYFEAHGTGTPAGDPVEAEAIHSVFGGRHDNYSLVSPHTERDRHATSPLYVGVRSPARSSNSSKPTYLLILLIGMTEREDSDRPH